MKVNKQRRIWCKALILTFSVATTKAISGDVPFVLRIDLDRAMVRASPLHSGLMMEEINHSFDGGLYAELIRDRGLTGGPTSAPDKIGSWKLIGRMSNQDVLALEAGDPADAANPRRLRVTAGSAELHHRVGVANEGFW